MGVINFMSTLLMRLAGPMQSWGTQSRFSIRDTGQEPSKSGVIGLLCAALGKPREEKESDPFPSLQMLASLKMGVRVDLPGKMQRDFQTAGGAHRQTQKDSYGVIKADAKSKGTVVSERYYLSDANFLVGLESDDLALLQRLEQALACPHWQIFLGRKAFVPSLSVYVPNGLKNSDLKETLKNHPWNPFCQAEKDKNPGQVEKSKRPDKLQIILDTTLEASSQVRQDVPISFADRHFTIRYTFTEYIDTPSGGD
jgi:CRISPR system Cascade subunit CasD